ncbi:MAG TPA: carbamoyltransferase [Candidatus Binatia bacterium]|nr:carbamoyltransferase [Candidatus Binatia bacterium]
MRHVLGISAYYHDSAAALLRDGRIVAAAQEERFTRKKNDERFPTHAAAFCLNFTGIAEADLDAVVFYDKPITKFARLLESYLAVAPRGLITFPRVLPSWLSEKLNLRKTIRDELPRLRKDCKILFTEHHQSHAASAFYPSPFKEAAILTVDGVGEWATTTIALGSGTEIDILKELRFPHSLGLLYSAFTAYCGFRINSGEYKLMGLAPYGQPKYAAAIYDNLIDLKPDGSFWLNMDYFAFLRSLVMTNEKFHTLFGGPPRKPESAIDSRHKDVAASIQSVTNEIMLRLARHAREITGLKHLCIAGGVALNCVANGLILREKIFDDLWIQPAAGDAGGALGAALAVTKSRCDMQSALLGPEFSEAEIESTLRSHSAVYDHLDDAELLRRSAELIAAEKVVGWVQGRMEFGPRALGSRSILGDPRSPKMQSQMNLKIKFRESFRPFAPVVRAERVSDYFELDGESPYMLLVAPARKSGLPAVTHVDNSARIQTLKREDNPRFYALLEGFEKLTGCPVLINTSFNVRGEPIVCTPDDAYRCLVNTEMDYLVMGNFILDRLKQPHKKIARTFEAIPD